MAQQQHIKAGSIYVESTRTNQEVVLLQDITIPFADKTHRVLISGPSDADPNKAYQLIQSVEFGNDLKPLAAPQSTDTHHLGRVWTDAAAFRLLDTVIATANHRKYANRPNTQADNSKTLSHLANDMCEWDSDVFPYAAALEYMQDLDTVGWKFFVPPEIKDPFLGNVRACTNPVSKFEIGRDSPSGSPDVSVNPSVLAKPGTAWGNNLMDGRFFAPLPVPQVDPRFKQARARYMFAMLDAMVHSAMLSMLRAGVAKTPHYYGDSARELVLSFWVGDLTADASWNLFRRNAVWLFEWEHSVPRMPILSPLATPTRVWRIMGIHTGAGVLLGIPFTWQEVLEQKEWTQSGWQQLVADTTKMTEVQDVSQHFLFLPNRTSLRVAADVDSPVAVLQTHQDWFEDTSKLGLINGDRQATSRLSILFPISSDVSTTAANDYAKGRTVRKVFEALHLGIADADGLYSDRKNNEALFQPALDPLNVAIQSMDPRPPLKTAVELTTALATLLIRNFFQYAAKDLGYKGDEYIKHFNAGDPNMWTDLVAMFPVEATSGQLAMTSMSKDGNELVAKYPKLVTIWLYALRPLLVWFDKDALLPFLSVLRQALFTTSSLLDGMFIFKSSPPSEDKEINPNHTMHQLFMDDKKDVLAPELTNAWSKLLRDTNQDQKGLWILPDMNVDGGRRSQQFWEITTWGELANLRRDVVRNLPLPAFLLRETLALAQRKEMTHAGAYQATLDVTWQTLADEWKGTPNGPDMVLSMQKALIDNFSHQSMSRYLQVDAVEEYRMRLLYNPVVIDGIRKQQPVQAPTTPPQAAGGEAKIAIWDDLVTQVLAKVKADPVLAQEMTTKGVKLPGITRFFAHTPSFAKLLRPPGKDKPALLDVLCKQYVDKKQNVPARYDGNAERLKDDFLVWLYWTYRNDIQAFVETGADVNKIPKGALSVDVLQEFLFNYSTNVDPPYLWKDHPHWDKFATKMKDIVKEWNDAKAGTIPAWLSNVAQAQPKAGRRVTFEHHRNYLRQGEDNEEDEEEEDEESGGDVFGFLPDTLNPTVPLTADSVSKLASVELAQTAVMRARPWDLENTLAGHAGWFDELVERIPDTPQRYATVREALDRALMRNPQERLVQAMSLHVAEEPKWLTENPDAKTVILPGAQNATKGFTLRNVELLAPGTRVTTQHPLTGQRVQGTVVAYPPDHLSVFVEERNVAADALTPDEDCFARVCVRAVHLSDLINVQPAATTNTFADVVAELFQEVSQHPAKQLLVDTLRALVFVGVNAESNYMNRLHRLVDSNEECYFIRIADTQIDLDAIFRFIKRAWNKWLKAATERRVADFLYTSGGGGGGGRLLTFQSPDALSRHEQDAEELFQLSPSGLSQNDLMLYADRPQFEFMLRTYGQGDRVTFWHPNYDDVIEAELLPSPSSFVARVKLVRVPAARSHIDVMRPWRGVWVVAARELVAGEGCSIPWSAVASWVRMTGPDRATHPMELHTFFLRMAAVYMVHIQSILQIYGTNSTLTVGQDRIKLPIWTYPFPVPKALADKFHLV